MYWEYKVLYLGVVELSTHEAELNAVAADGWELFDIVRLMPSNFGIVYYFRRQALESIG